jgi:hypothetical protein
VTIAPAKMSNRVDAARNFVKRRSPTGVGSLKVEMGWRGFMRLRVASLRVGYAGIAGNSQRATRNLLGNHPEMLVATGVSAAIHLSKSAFEWT